MPAEKSGGRVQVGDWIVEPALDSISRDGKTHKLEPRTMRLLMYLVDSAGTVVSIEHLLNEVWTGVIVGSASVYQAVSQLRKLLGDTDPEPTYIETVPRKGYRLIAAVGAVDPPRQETAADQPPAATPRVRSAATSHRLGLMAMRGIALAALMSLAWLLLRKPPLAEAAAASIAVLPFVDLTAEKNDQPFCDGLTEELSNWLSQIPTLRVVARTSAFAFRGQVEDVRKIGKTLNTNHILEGSMRRSGDHMRITVQLVDVRNGYHLWSTSYDRPIDDTIKVQEEISRSVAAILEVRLTPDTAQRFAARRTANPQAYQLYLRARHYQQQRTRDSNVRAIDLYRQVLDADPKFALAYVGLSYARLNQIFFENRPVAEVAGEVEPLIDAALRIDAGLSDAYSVRGALRSDQAKTNEALDDLHHAISLNSSDSKAYAEIGRIFLWNGQPRDSLSSFRRAAALDPLDFRLQTQLCTVLADMARYDEAAAACQQARALQPDSSLAADELSWLAASRGAIDEALRWNAESIRDAPDNFDLYWTRSELFLTLGLAKRAREAVEQGRAATKDNDDADAALAKVAYCEGGPDAVREHLIAARLDKSPHAVSLLEAAYSRLVVGEAPAAKQVIALALAAPDLTPGLADIPWYARFGTAYRLDLAAAELEMGERAAALHQLDALLAMLDRMIDAGVERNLTYQLRAEVQALRGNPDDSMRDLTKAADLGWRRVWWAEHEPYFALLHRRSDFRALMARVSRSNDRLVDKLGAEL